MVQDSEILEFPFVGAASNEPVLEPAATHRFHYWITLALGAALAPVLAVLHLPLRFRWEELAAPFIGCALQSVIALAIIFSIQHPREVYGMIRRKSASHYILLSLLLGFIYLKAGGLNFDFFIWTAFALIVPEMKSYLSWKVLTRFTVAGAYFFIALVIMFAYGTIVPAVRD